uniref:Prolyl 4-hydroxylase alpha subunit Fe(2+) 2OG dioxygenase domain-containing protein n=1 Tax=Chrysotila carterae TaxID=13221 RepID=A0A7S4BKS7_CHRCT
MLPSSFSHWPSVQLLTPSRLGAALAISDGYSGSLAWVFHLSPEWKSEHGGQLRFNPSTRSGLNIGARDFEPSFNRLLLFRTRPAALAHQVLPVSRPAGAHPRFAFTGWYMMPNDVMSAEGLKQLQLMRSASAAGTHDMCV